MKIYRLIENRFHPKKVFRDILPSPLEAISRSDTTTSTGKISMLNVMQSIAITFNCILMIFHRQVQF